MNTKFLKKTFITIAYVAYIFSTIMQNHLHIDLTYYNYIFVAIIGVSLKLSENTEIIEKIITNYDIPFQELLDIRKRIDSLIESSQPSERSSTVIDIPMNDVNEPITPSNELDRQESRRARVASPEPINTHRDIELSNGNIIRIHQIK